MKQRKPNTAPSLKGKISRRDGLKHAQSLFTEQDIYLFKEGNHFRLYDKLGSREMTVDGINGVYFAVWAPNADKVSVMGEFNGWGQKADYLDCRWDDSGIWEGFIPDTKNGQLYKYHIVSRHNGYQVDKGDPYAF
ncbi:1,4-alpha-glucan branching protein GlgB, partial [Candidatus Omnitrophota bacterium]